jgi:hypothetical protein
MPGESTKGQAAGVDRQQRRALAERLHDTGPESLCTTPVEAAVDDDGDHVTFADHHDTQRLGLPEIRALCAHRHAAPSLSVAILSHSAIAAPAERGTTIASAYGPGVTSVR